MIVISYVAEYCLDGSGYGTKITSCATSVGHPKVFGSRFLGLWFFLFLVLGSWLLVLGSWFLVLGYWLLVLGSWLLALGSWLLVLGLGLGSWFLNQGLVLSSSPWFFVLFF
jgi:hypothetical protein